MIGRTLLLLLLPVLLLADDIIPQHLVNALVARREAVRQWAITCPDSWGEFAGQYSTIDETCWQGDMTMFAGMACLAAELAGDEETARTRCADVAAAQEPSGRWVRGPTWVGKDYPDGDFSRDQTRGTFAYLIAKGYVSQDPGEYAQAVTAAEKWRDWVRDHDGDICLEDKRSCEMTVGTYNMAYNVFRRLGVLPGWKDGPVVRRMYRSRWYYRWGFLAETRLLFFDEWTRDKWYPRHLKASTLLLYRVLNMDPVTRRVRHRRAARSLGKAARRIYKGDPENPLYRLLYEGVTVNLVERVLDTFTSPTKPPALNKIHDWFMQRHTEERAWERSDGHDAIYLLNLILARINGRLPW